MSVESPFDDVSGRLGVQQSGQLRAQVIEHGPNQLVLGAEVTKHQPVVDLGSSGDVANRRRGWPTLGEQVGGGLQDCGRYLFPPSGHLAAVGCRTRSHPATVTDVVI
ncbi:Uncharacterised protein [Mycobacterium tuberculosis]|nr:Uncharacterised protein [Mycobacterium tuberculosis]